MGECGTKTAEALRAPAQITDAECERKLSYQAALEGRMRN